MTGLLVRRSRLRQGPRRCRKASRNACEIAKRRGLCREPVLAITRRKKTAWSWPSPQIRLQTIGVYNIRLLQASLAPPHVLPHDVREQSELYPIRHTACLQAEQGQLQGRASMSDLPSGQRRCICDARWPKTPNGLWKSHGPSDHIHLVKHVYLRPGAAVEDEQMTPLKHRDGRYCTMRVE